MKPSSFEIDFFNCDNVIEVNVTLSNFEVITFGGVVALYEADGRLVIEHHGYNGDYNELTHNCYCIKDNGYISYEIVEKRGKIEQTRD